MELFDTVVTEQAKQNVMDCLNSGYLSEGKMVAQFEKALEETFGYRNCVAVNSGTSALHLALILAGVKAGDEVILPAQTFVATGMAILYCGATPVFADIDKETGNISVDSVSDKITDRTRAVICVSWGGNPCDLEKLQGLYYIERDIFLIQDNAQALGAAYYGKPITRWGDFSCFSFQAIKHLTTGDGGLLVCPTETDSLSAKDLRWFGISREDDVPDETGERQYNLTRYESLGYKYHMNDYSAALGLGNLNRFWDRQKRINEIFVQYNTYLSQWTTATKAGSSHWLCDLLVENRTDFMRMMKSKDIPTSVVHVGIDRNDIFGGKQEDLVNQRYWDEHHVCIPCHSSLTDDDVNKVVEAVNGGW